MLGDLKFLLSCAVVCAAPGLLGCGADQPPGPAVYKIVGTVKFDDGTPLADGTVLLVPVDGLTNPASADIVEGQFETEATEGTKTVMVSQLKVIGTERINVPTAEPGQGPTVEIKEEQVSREFNEMSKETVDIKAIEENRIELTVKRADPNARPLSQPF
jgi:hypothetical protein